MIKNHDDPSNRPMKDWDEAPSEGDSCCVEKCHRRPARMTVSGSYCRWHWRVLAQCATPGCSNPSHDGSIHCRVCLVGDGDRDEMELRRTSGGRTFSPVVLMELYSK